MQQVERAAQDADFRTRSGAVRAEVMRRLRADGGYWIDGDEVGRREPGSAG